jgi:hypothetical protein
VSPSSVYNGSAMLKVTLPGNSPPVLTAIADFGSPFNFYQKILLPTNTSIAVTGVLTVDAGDSPPIVTQPPQRPGGGTTTISGYLDPIFTIAADDPSQDPSQYTMYVSPGFGNGSPPPAISLSGLNSGNAVEGQQVSATITDPDAPASGIAYTWTVNGNTVSTGDDAAGSTYTPDIADEGLPISVAASFADTNRNFQTASASAGTVAPPPCTPAFYIDDVTTGAQTTAADPYVGPVAGLLYQYIYTGSDDLNVAAATPNVFIHTGGGEDAIDVSQGGGTNVLDGGTNSNFLVGGTGPDSFDTFFVDDRSPSADIWSTVANFHAGDAATIFGITQDDGFTTNWVDGQGAAGYTGLTLHVTAADLPTASLTLAGYGMADLSNGRLSTSFGTEADGTPYLYIHANS